MSTSSTMTALLLRAEIGIKELIGADKCMVFMGDPQEGTIYKYNPDTKLKETFDCNAGLAGQCYTTSQMINEKHPLQNPAYNDAIDIPTKLPLLCFPVRSARDDHPVIGVIEMSNVKSMNETNKQNEID